MARTTSPGTRGQAEVVGFVLILAIAVVGVGSVLALGQESMDGMQNSVELDRAANAFAALDGRTMTVAHGKASTTAVDLGLGSRQRNASLSATDSGWLRVSYVNLSSGNETVVLNQTLGRITYTTESGSVAYQGGGVWRVESGTVTMVSPPELGYRDGTLTLPLVTLEGTVSMHEPVRVTALGTTTRVYPNRSRQANLTNPVPRNAEIKVTIHSRFADAWARYLETRTEGTVSSDGEQGEVTLRLSAAPPAVDHALTAIGGSGGQLLIQDQVVVNTYNSSDATVTFGGGANIVTNLDVDLHNQIDVNGNLVTSAGANLSGLGSNGTVTGHLAYGSGSVADAECSEHVTDWCADNGTVDGYTTLDTRIDTRMDRIRSANDNGAVAGISNGSLDWSDTDQITLTAGSYYFDGSFQVQGSNSDPQQLILDTSGGNIEIAIDGISAQLQNHGNVTVKGEGVVRIYANDQVQVQDHAEVWIPGYNASQLWTYCTADCQVQVNNGDPRYIGVLYAPSTGSAGGEIQIQDQAVIYGGIVAGEAQIQNDVVIHYDTALGSETVFPTMPPEIYLQVTTTSVEVSPT